MRFQRAFTRTVNGTGTALGADSAPSGKPNELTGDNQFSSSLSDVNGWPIQRVCVAYKGPAAAKALPATLYVYDDTTDSWYAMGAAKTMQPGRLTWFDQPSLGRLASMANQGSTQPIGPGGVNVPHNPGCLNLCLVVAGTGADPDGSYTFAVGMDISNTSDDAAMTASGALSVQEYQAPQAENNVAGIIFVGERPIGTPDCTPVNVTSTVAETGHVLKAAAGVLYYAMVHNDNAAARYIHIFDAIAVPANGAAPKVVVKLGIGETRLITFGERGRYFPTGISIASSSTFATLTLGSADMWVDAGIG